MSKKRPDPDPSPAAPAARVIDFQEKRLNVISFRCPEVLDRLIQRQADREGTTKSNYCRTVLQGEICFQVRKRLREAA